MEGAAGTNTPRLEGPSFTCDKLNCQTANIGGAASAPVVAAAFHPSLAPVGALLAVAGYVLGTYAGLICMHLLKWVAGAS